MIRPTTRENFSIYIKPIKLENKNLCFFMPVLVRQPLVMMLQFSTETSLQLKIVATLSGPKFVFVFRSFYGNHYKRN